MTMDSSTLTHVAAIVVGVLVTLAIKSAFQSQNEVPAAIAPAGGAGANKKKKKKKKKGGGGGDTASSDPAPAPQKEAAKVEINDRSIKALEPDANGGGGAAATHGKGKKKKNKANKGDQANTAAAASQPAATPATNGSSGNNAAAKKNDDPPFIVPPEELVWQPAPKQQEEEWGVVGKNNKKKNRAQKPKVAKPAAGANGASSNPTVATDSVVVDAKKIGVIIGPKGATMKGIEEATGCKLDINAPSKDDPPPKNNKPQKATVVLSGDKESMAKAKKAVLELANKGYASILQSDGFGEYSIAVHPRYLSEIVGPGGQTIKAIQSALDVKLTIPSTEWKPNAVQVGPVKMAKVGIAGSKDNARQAKAVIQSLMKYHHHEITHPGMVHEQVHVPQEFFHCVIGTRGSEIKHIRGNFKVDMYMPNSDSMIDDVLVVGKQANVDRAITYIQTLIDRDTENRERKYHDEYYGE